MQTGHNVKVLVTMVSLICFGQFFLYIFEIAKYEYQTVFPNLNVFYLSTQSFIRSFIICCLCGIRLPGQQLEQRSLSPLLLPFPLQGSEALLYQLWGMNSLARPGSLQRFSAKGTCPKCLLRRKSRRRLNQMPIRRLQACFNADERLFYSEVLSVS